MSSESVAMQKYDVINLLAEKYGYRSYLEICTPTTGLSYGHIDRRQLFSRRLMYRCPENFRDGLDITYRTDSTSSHEIVKAILKSNLGRGFYDIVFVDPYHSYESSMTDLLGAYALTKPGGIVVMHDCNPDDAALAEPDFNPQRWCGVTYQAFADFLLPRGHLKAFTVDCDYGCGVVFKPEGDTGAADLLALDWHLAKQAGDEARYTFFDRHRVELLHLVDEDGFVVGEDLTWPRLPMRRHASGRVLT